jgi:hypothetical protein
MLCEHRTYISLGSLRRGPLLGKALRESGTRRSIAEPEEEPGPAPEGGRTRRLLKADPEERPAATLYEGYALGYSLR